MAEADPVHSIFAVGTHPTGKKTEQQIMVRHTGHEYVELNRREQCGDWLWPIPGRYLPKPGGLAPKAPGRSK